MRSILLQIFKQPVLWLALPLAALVLLVACAPTATLNVMASTESATVTQAVAYGPSARHRLDIYRPSTTAPAAGWPVVVFF